MAEPTAWAFDEARGFGHSWPFIRTFALALDAARQQGYREGRDAAAHLCALEAAKSDDRSVHAKSFSRETIKRLARNGTRIGGSHPRPDTGGQDAMSDADWWSWIRRNPGTDISRLLAEIDKRGAEIATLRERLEWPDISTAPKDGSTIVDLWCVHPNLPAQRSANMVYRRGKWVTAGIIVEPLNPGWTATHWLPLPTTPAPKESKGE